MFYCKLDFKDWLFMCTCTGTVISVPSAVQITPNYFVKKCILFPWILYLGQLVTRLTSRIKKVDIHKDYQTTGNGDTYVIETLCQQKSCGMQTFEFVKLQSMK